LCYTDFAAAIFNRQQRMLLRFELISKADAGLNEIKRKTHFPEYGWHERRK
jgi:hypothetical protein